MTENKPFGIEEVLNRRSVSKASMKDPRVAEASERVNSLMERARQMREAKRETKPELTDEEKVQRDLKRLERREQMLIKEITSMEDE